MSFKINKLYNWFRKIMGLEYWSLSQYLKYKVKNALTYINDFKFLSLKKLDEVDCNSIMIGHIHTPSIEKIGEKTYYNTGDMVESLSYIIEDLDGNIKLLYCS
jgi:UDP-2,3-diacylglucosamine pyrophosphatase LpxH